jgi:glycosyltransferase involved in cell wall biosynthesis
MATKSVFFIASILPHKGDAFAGDFILRHAQAIALKVNVTCVFICDTNDTYSTKTTDVEEQGNLKIYRIYLPSKGTQWTYYKNIFQLFTQLGGTNVFDLVHANIHWRAGLAAYFLKLRFGIKYVLTEHLGYFNEYIYKAESVAQYPWLKLQLTKRILKHASVCMPVSNYLANLMRIVHAGANCAIVPNVVDTNLCRILPENKPEVFTFLHASGTQIYQKNILAMLEGLKLAIDKGCVFKLNLVMPNLPQVIEKIAALKLDTIVDYLPAVPYEKMPLLLNQSHAFLLYSIEETFSCVLAEAHCCGVPTIAPMQGGPLELCTEKNAVMCNPHDPNSLANAVESMINNYIKFDQNTIAAAAKARYNYDTIATQIIAVYDTVK